MKRVTIIPAVLVVLLLTFGLSQHAVAQQQKIDNPDIRVGVNGMSRPFCAYGIEKKMKKIKSIKKLYVNINASTVI